MSRKRASRLGIGGSREIKQGTFLSNAAISSQLGRLIRVFFSLMSPPGVAIEVSSSVEQASFLVEELATNSCLDLTVSEEGTYAIRVSGIGSSRDAFGQIFLANKGATESASKALTMPLLKIDPHIQSHLLFFLFWLKNDARHHWPRLPTRTILTESEPVESWSMPFYVESDEKERDGDKFKAFSIGRKIGFLVRG